MNVNKLNALWLLYDLISLGCVCDKHNFSLHVILCLAEGPVPALLRLAGACRACDYIGVNSLPVSGTQWAAGAVLQQSWTIDQHPEDRSLLLPLRVVSTVLQRYGIVFESFGATYPGHAVLGACCSRCNDAGQS